MQKRITLQSKNQNLIIFFPFSAPSLRDQDNEIFSGSSEEESTCLYDDGGPLVTRSGGDSGYSLIGVVAFWDCIEVLAVPGLYTEVSHFLSWIAEEYGVSLS